VNQLQESKRLAPKWIRTTWRRSWREDGRSETAVPRLRPGSGVITFPAPGPRPRPGRRPGMATFPAPPTWAPAPGMAPLRTRPGPARGARTRRCVTAGTDARGMPEIVSPPHRLNRDALEPKTTNAPGAAANT